MTIVRKSAYHTYVVNLIGFGFGTTCVIQRNIAIAVCHRVCVLTSVRVKEPRRSIKARLYRFTKHLLLVLWPKGAGCPTTSQQRVTHLASTIKER